MSNLISKVDIGVTYTHYKKKGKYMVLNNDALGQYDGEWIKSVIYRSLNDHDRGKEYVRQYEEFLKSFKELI